MGDALLESQRILTGILVFFIGYDLVFRYNEDIFFRSISLVSLIVFISALFNTYVYGIESEVSYLFGHKNLQSSILFICLPFVGITAYKSKGFWRIFTLSLFISIVLFIIYSNVRSNQLAIIFSVILFLGLSLIKKTGIKKIFLFGYLFGLLLSLGWLLTQPESIGSKDPSIEERFGLWSNSFKIIEDDAVTGIGAGNWQHHYTKYGVNHLKRSYDYNISFRRPHNDYLRVFAEVGLVGITVFLLFGFYLVFRSSKSLLDKNNIPLLMSLSGIIGISIISFFSFPHERIVHLVLSATLLSYLCSKILTPREISLKSKKIFSLIGIVFILMNLGFTYYRIKGEYYTKLSLQAQIDQKGRDAITYGTKALSPFYETDPTGMPIYAYIGWGYHEITNLDSMLYSAEQAYLLRPFDYRILNNYGLILERLHYYRSAKKVFEESHRINSKYEPTIINLSVLEYNHGHYEEAKIWLSQIEDSKSKYPENWKRIDHAIETGEFGTYQ